MDITEKETIHKVLLNHLSIILGIYNVVKISVQKVALYKGITA